MHYITGNWSSKDWTPHVFTQKDGQTNITSGTDFKTKAVEFKCSVHGPSHEVYPQKSDRFAVLTNVAYTALYFPMKGVTAAGNAVVGSGNLLIGTYQSVRNFSDKEFNKKEAFTPVLANVKQLLKDGAVALTAYIAFSGEKNLYLVNLGFEFWGYNVQQVAAIAFLGAATLYAVQNPQGYQRTIHKYVGRIDATPMTDGEVHNANLFKKGVAILDGRYSLARLLGMQYVGKSTQDKFQEVKQQ